MKEHADVDLRDVPRRPFGVYVLVFILLLGVFVATLEIVRLQFGLEGFWADAELFLRDYSGMVSMVSELFTNPTIVTIANAAIIVVWLALIAGMWYLKRWAWLMVMIFSGINLTYALFRYFNDNPDYISMLVNVAVIFYLNDRSVQHAYARRNVREPA